MSVLDDAAVIRAKLEAIPWVPAIITPNAPVLPVGSVATTNTGTITPAADLVFSQKMKRATSLAAKLTSPKSPVLDVNSLTVQDISADDVGMVLRVFGNSEALEAPIVRDVLFERVKSTNGRFGASGMGLFQISAVQLLGGRFRDLSYRGVAPNTDPNNAPAVIALQGKEGFSGGSDIVIERFDFRDLLSNVTGYQQGDFIAVEKTYSGVRIRHGYCSNAPDAGLDIKASDCRIDEVEVVNTRESMKNWEPNWHGALYSRNPRFAHIMVMGEAGRYDLASEPVVYDFVDFSNTAGTQPLIRAEKGPVKVVIRDYKVDGCQPGTLLLSKQPIANGTTIDWGWRGPPGNGLTL